MAYPPSNYYYPPLPHRRRLPRYRGRSCLIWGCLVMLIAPLSCSCLLFLSYLLFPPPSTDILVLGIDARPNEGAITRTDSIMLVNISARQNDITLLSIPRDVFIEVPEYGEQRINTINVLGEMEAEGYGPTLLEASFDKSFGVDVDHYVRLDFNAFIEMIDAVGGVDIDVPKEIIDYEYPTMDGGVITIHFMPGEQHMDGERALQYARTRHADDDYQRAARQQQVLDALVQKMANPVYWPRLWQIIQNNTDTDLSTWEMIRLSPAVLFGWQNRTQRVLNREDLIGMQAGYWIPNYEQIQPWIDEHFD